MLLISVEVVAGDKRKVLAQARLANLSAGADVSDYALYVEEGANPVAGAGEWQTRGVVENHDRNQTVWALVSKVAAVAEAEAKRAKK